MKSGWVDRDAEAMVAHFAQTFGEKSGVDRDIDRDISRDLALRVYTTRLLGRDPKLVLHGGGNTSLKTAIRDRFGEDVEVLYVKSSGADMAAIEPDGFSAVRLDPMRKLRALDAIDDDELVGIERANLIDPAAANPSVEMMLHAFLPHKFVDHSHATAVLSVIDQPDGEKKCAEVFGRRLAFVPYAMPGFGLAKKAIEAFERAKPGDGLILSKHGIVTFGDTARESYERMIEMVSLAEDFIARQRKSLAVAPVPHNIAGASAHRADRARGVQREGCRKRGRLAAACSRIPRRRRGFAIPRREGFGAAEPGRGDNAGSHHPHQELAAGFAGPGDRHARRLRTRDARAAQANSPRTIGIFRAQQQTRRRHQARARSAAPRRAGARARLVRARTDQARRRDRRRYRRSLDRGRERRRGDRPLRVDLRGRHVRLRILAAGTGQARRAATSCRWPAKSLR